MKKAPISVELIGHLGSDLDVVNAARVSFNKESGWDFGPSGTLDAGTKFLSMNDTKLVKYLADHQHWSPFSHCFVRFRIKAPIFVARQLQKHTVGLAWNEVSRRYVDFEPEFYMPEGWRERSNNAKQGSEDVMVMGSENYQLAVDRYVSHLVSLYSGMIGGGICPEQARMILPQNMMTEWWWSGSLYAFVRVCKLRLDSHAQRETREVAEGIAEHLAQLFPVSWGALMEDSKEGEEKCL